MIAKVLQIPANRVQVKTKRLGTCNQIHFYRVLNIPNIPSCKI